MKYQIYIESRMDKQKSVIDAIKELTSDFTIFTGTAYFNGNHRPCQVIEVNSPHYLGDAVKACVGKLKKILNTPHIMVTRTDTHEVLY